VVFESGKADEVFALLESGHTAGHFFYCFGCSFFDVSRTSDNTGWILEGWALM
jgi:hypothetical protein